MSSEVKIPVSLAANGTLKSVYEAVAYAKFNSPFYRRVFAETILLEDQFSETVLKQLPFTTKEDISENNLDFLAVPMNQVAEFCTTSGTSGEPITMYLTKEDLKNLALLH